MFSVGATLAPPRLTKKELRRKAEEKRRRTSGRRTSSPTSGIPWAPSTRPGTRARSAASTTTSTATRSPSASRAAPRTRRLARGGAAAAPAAAPAAAAAPAERTFADVRISEADFGASVLPESDLKNGLWDYRDPTRGTGRRRKTRWAKAGRQFKKDIDDLRRRHELKKERKLLRKVRAAVGSGAAAVSSSDDATRRRRDSDDSGDGLDVDAPAGPPPTEAELADLAWDKDRTLEENLEHALKRVSIRAPLGQDAPADVLEDIPNDAPANPSLLAFLDND
ncbi:hypothetical protein JL721_1960 [Aureococcus anophagefferens]|nr:hypothetical protein JL721_1960 [Aureococcus anophagefferens]